MLSFAIDLLHTWYLGPTGSYVASVLWLILEVAPWGQAPAWLDPEDVQRIGLLHIKTKLRNYYKKKRGTDDDWTTRGSEVSFLCTPSQLELLDSSTQDNSTR